MFAVTIESQPGKAEGKRYLSLHHYSQTKNTVLFLLTCLQTKGLHAFLRHCRLKWTWIIGFLELTCSTRDYFPLHYRVPGSKGKGMAYKFTFTEVQISYWFDMHMDCAFPQIYFSFTDMNFSNSYIICMQIFLIGFRYMISADYKSMTYFWLYVI